jgi:hypothetical protein
MDVFRALLAKIIETEACDKIVQLKFQNLC